MLASNPNVLRVSDWVGRKEREVFPGFRGINLKIGGEGVQLCR
jgi:hypothetical protein